MKGIHFQKQNSWPTLRRNPVSGFLSDFKLYKAAFLEKSWIIVALVLTLVLYSGLRFSENSLEGYTVKKWPPHFWPVFKELWGRHNIRKTS